MSEAWQTRKEVKIIKRYEKQSKKGHHMKKITMAAIILINSAFASEHPTQPVTPIISVDRIIKNEKKIAGLLKNRSYYRGVFTAAKVGMGTFAALQAAASTINTAAWLFGYNQPLSIPHDTYRLESKKEWVIKNVLSAISTLGFYYLFAKTEQQYGSEANIRWFVVVKQPFYITLRELYFLAQQAVASHDSPQLIIEMKQRFAKLVDQTEQVIAFMHYKKESFPEARKADAQHVITHLIERIESLYQDIAHAIDTDTHNVSYHLDSALMILEGDCARFALSERSRWINPSAVLDMMQNFV